MGARPSPVSRLPARPFSCSPAIRGAEARSCRAISGRPTRLHGGQDTLHQRNAGRREAVGPTDRLAPLIERRKGRGYGNVTYWPRKARADAVSTRYVTSVERHHVSPVTVIDARTRVPAKKCGPP